MSEINILETLKDVGSFLEPIYSNIIISVIILLIGLIVGKVVGRLSLKLLNEIELNNLFRLATGMTVKVDQISSSVISYFIYFVFTMWALENLGLGSIILNILAGGVILLVLIAIVLGIKDFFPNVIAGLFLHGKRIIKEGENVEIDSINGKVVHIGLVETELSSSEGDRIYVPNAAFLKSRTIKVKKKPKKNK
ncbi:MAG: mechanosensitive ion channel domain-containing protein [Candidatus Nanoarchaeia archaeon]